MKKLIGVMLAVMLLAMTASAAFAEDQGKTMYVYTKNGKGLYVRTSMTTDEDNIVGTLPYGSKVVTYGKPQYGWIYIDYGSDGDHYVMYRYLVKNKPAPYSPSDNPPSSGTGSFDSRSAVTVDQINTLLKGAKAVVPYTVTVRPTRSSGWVYMRWLPSRNSTQVATYAANMQLQVIAELKDWYQVQDPETGSVGFVYKDYIH